MIFSRKRSQFLLFFVDFLILILSLYLSLCIRKNHFPSFSLFISHAIHFLLIWFVFLISMYTLNLYSIDKSFVSRHFIFSLFICACIALLIGTGYFYIIDLQSMQPKTILILAITFSYVFIIVWRNIYDCISRKANKQLKYIFIGYNETFFDIVNASLMDNYVNFMPIALYTTNTKSLPNQVKDSIVILENPIDLQDFIRKENIKIFVLAPDFSPSKEIIKILFSALATESVFYSTAEFYEIIFRKIPLGAINEFYFLQGITLQNKGIYHFIKRLFDIMISILTLVFIIPFVPIIALVIKLESSGPVFFTQIREGKNGKTFKLYKFRTMRTDKNNFSPTTEKDSRITKFGNFMRVTRIDELPQMLNVLKGDMSLIGPRPERPELACELEKEIPFYRQRLIVKPGITGWDQVSGEYHSPSTEDTYKKLQYDLYYIKNQSIFLDLSILFKTILTVFHKLGR